MTSSSLPKRLVAGLASFALIALALIGFATPASAHRINESYLYFNVLEDSIEARLELRVDDINEVLGLNIPDDPEAAEAAVVANRTLLEDFARPHLHLTEGGSDWDYTFTDIALLETENGMFALLSLDVNKEFAEVPRAWEVELDVFFDELPDNRAFVLIESYWDGGIFNNEANALHDFKVGDTIQTVTLDDPSFFAGLGGTIDLGIEHIEIGTDHILFVLVLLLPSVLVFGRGDSDQTGFVQGDPTWMPAQDFKSSFWKVLKIATMFTIAHSITLTLAGLGLFELPSRPVEALIALSIIAAAFHNLRPVFNDKEWLIAFGFGLFHGLGFAGLLTDLGLDRTNRVWSLLGFNIGVEIGQAFIILVIFPVLFILRRTSLYAHVLRFGSLGMALIATNWFIERVFDVETGLGEYVDKVLKFPRVLAPIAVTALFAFVWQRREAGRDALLPLPDAEQRSATGETDETDETDDSDDSAPVLV